MELKLNPLEKEIFGTLVDEAQTKMGNSICDEYPIEVTDENRENLCELIINAAYDDDQRERLLNQLNNGKQVFFMGEQLMGYLKSAIENA
jgi:hypothetical protein